LAGLDPWGAAAEEILRVASIGPIRSRRNDRGRDRVEPLEWRIGHAGGSIWSKRSVTDKIYIIRIKF
jgi:hypothetical protein